MKKVLAAILAFVLIFGLAGCGKSENVKRTEELITAIGTVSINSGETIIEAEKAYNSLTEKEKTEVSNAAVLNSDKAEFVELLASRAFQSLNDAYAFMDVMSGDVYDAWYTGAMTNTDLSAEKLSEETRLSKEEVALGLGYLTYKYAMIFSSKGEETPTFKDWEEQDEKNKETWINNNSILFSMIDKKIITGGYEPICCEMVRTVYTLNGKLEEGEENLATAQRLIKEIESIDPSYQYLDNLKDYYKVCSSLLDFCKEPKGSLLQFSSTLNDYRNSVKENVIDLEFAFDTN